MSGDETLPVSVTSWQKTSERYRASHPIAGNMMDDEIIAMRRALALS